LCWFRAKLFLSLPVKIKYVNVFSAVCGCAKNSNNDAMLTVASHSYQQQVQALINSGIYNDRDDFAVTLQPFFRDTEPVKTVCNWIWLPFPILTKYSNKYAFFYRIVQISINRSVCIFLNNKYVMCVFKHMKPYKTNYYSRFRLVLNIITNMLFFKHSLYPHKFI